MKDDNFFMINFNSLLNIYPNAKLQNEFERNNWKISAMLMVKLGHEEADYWFFFFFNIQLLLRINDQTMFQ